MTHRVWAEAMPVDGPAGVETRYQAVCACGWRQPQPTAKTSHAWRAGRRHQQRED